MADKSAYRRHVRSFPKIALNPRVWQAPEYEKDLDLTETRLFLRIKRELKLKVEYPPIRSSAWYTWRECPRKFLYKERLGLTRFEYAQALEIGITTHQLLEEIMKGADTETLLRSAARRVAELEEEWVKFTDASGILPNGKTLREQLAEADRDFKLAVAMTKLFLKFFPIEEFKKHYDIVGTEEVFAVKVPKIYTPIVMRADLVLRSKKTGDYWFLDYKTLAGSGSTQSRASTLEWDFQARLYAWVVDFCLKKMNPDYRLGGWMHAILKKPGIRYTPNGVDRDGFDHYVQRVADWYDEQLVKNPNDPPFLLSTVVAPRRLVAAELFWQVHELGRACAIKPYLDAFPRDCRSCYGKYGSSPCPYISLCSNLVRKWRHIIPAEYVQSFRENPLEEGDS